VFLRLLRQARRADVVVSGSEVGKGVPAAWLASRIARRPFGIWVQCAVGPSADAWESERSQRLLWRAYRGADAVAVAVPALEAEMQLRAPQAVRHSVELAGDADAVRARAEEPVTVDLPPVFVLGLGRLTRQKGFDLLIQALAKVRSGGADVDLVIVGDGQERASLEALAAGLDVADHVHLVGFSANPFPILRRAALFCFPSRYEGFGYALLEAQMLGVPIVAADCMTGPRQLLQDGRFGRLVAVEDVDELSTALAEHFDDPSALTAKASARLARPFATREDMTRQFVGFVDDLASRRVRRRRLTAPGATAGSGTRSSGRSGP
jgi:glycosyltransferase involved in cell wall biosynthesis